MRKLSIFLLSMSLMASIAALGACAGGNNSSESSLLPDSSITDDSTSDDSTSDDSTGDDPTSGSDVPEPAVVAEYSIKIFAENLEGAYVEITSDYTDWVENRSGEVGETIDLTDEIAAFDVPDGYFFDSNHENSLVSGVIAEDGSLVLSLYYSLNTYQVSFDATNGEEVTFLNVKHGAIIEKPEVEPQKDCYEFVEWTYQREVFDFSTPIKENITLTAEWNQTHIYYSIKVFKGDIDITSEYNVEPVKVELGTTVDITETVKSYEIPEGFYFDANNNNLVGVATNDGLEFVVKFDKLLTATFKLNQEDEGVVVSGLKKGDLITIPDDIIPEGYDYAMWMNEGVRYDFNNGIEESIVLVVDALYIGVATTSEFMAMQADKNYVLEKDIDFTGVAYTSIATFNGILDGNGYSVKNVTMESSASGTAMFGTMSGTIQRINFENIVISQWAGMIGPSALIAKKLTGTISDMYLSGSMKGPVAAKTGWADYTTWGWVAGIVCHTCSGGVIKNAIIDVECSEGTDVKAIAGTGKVTYGIVTVMKGNNASSVFHTDFALLDPQWIGMTDIETASTTVWTSFNTVSPNAWVITENQMATLVQNYLKLNIQ